MSRFLSFAVVLLVALGCGRNEAVGPKESTRVPEPVVGTVEPPTPPDDGSIPPPREVPVRTRAQALALGVDYLVAQQWRDGSWRSDVYATFKDGTALTPLAVTALQEAHDAGVRGTVIDGTLTRAYGFLARFVKDGVVVPPADGFDYPIYTAALALKALSHPTAKEFAEHRNAWVKYLKERQLTEKLGWKPEEKQFGGWGYCRVIPKKPEPNTFAPSLIESNLSATLFALDALRAADALDQETAKTVAIFVRRCQNADGGFHFIYDDPTRNKAGKANDDPLLFHSYGSTTADGLQALALCNDPADKDRRDAARKWLIENFSADKHPGTYVKAHEPNRDAVYYYYAASATRAFRDHKLELPNGRDWTAEWSVELARRVAKDGSWTNPVELVRENEPLVATSNAVLALVRCGK
jgi:hypothetical protein